MGLFLIFTTGFVKKSSILRYFTTAKLDQTPALEGLEAVKRTLKMFTFSGNFLSLLYC